MTRDFYGGDSGEPEQHGFVDDADPGRGTRPRLWLAGILLSLVILLFLADRYVTLVQPNIERYKVQRDLQSVESLENDVVMTLAGYGIEDSWISRKKVELGEHGYMRDMWMVRVPHDLPLASLNLDLKSIATIYSGQAFAVEDARKAQLALHIKFRGLVRYSLIFAPTSDVRRQAGDVALLVDGLGEASSADIESFASGTDPIACIITPEKDNITLYTTLRKSEKEVVLHLHFQPVRQGDSRFELAEDLDEEELANHLRYIVRNFPGIRYYYITSERALDLHARESRRVLTELGLQQIRSDVLTYIDRASQEDAMSSRMNDIASIAAREGIAAGVVELRDGVLPFLHDEMRRLRKKGSDFISIRRFMSLQQDAAAE